ncbi:hypothetical protein CLV35_1744 [Motilibacter peucedani]|uniref:Uncharacterized protein n=1 Tax=Motilibacter peucedani TaxID=598650 RepID=A0A420XPW1_9ACTN|nr:GPGG-motif small membrane protein [Motilibacter peucedani]RKS75285.1 hypothetical protein CLV35_1744 [Motilibacter peucedani]
MVRGAGTGELLLTLVAALLVVAGVTGLVKGRQAVGTALVVAGMLVGPGLLALLR